jgi:hypothetical protein
VKIEKSNDSYVMDFVAEYDGTQYPLPPKAKAEFDAMKPEFEGRLMEPGVKEAVGERIQELCTKWFEDGGRYIFIPGIGFMNRGNLGSTS